MACRDVQLGIFEGIEFAWARQKYPGLCALAVAVNRKPYLRALLVVPANGNIARFADLEGQSLAVPRHSPGHCYRFLERLCQSQGPVPRHFQAEVTKPEDAEDALDDVVDGLIPAAIVEELSLDCYQRRKPGRFRCLRVLQSSEMSPVPVVVYHGGRLDEPTVQRLRQGMSNMKEDPVGQEILTLWRLTGFEPVPADYQEALEKIVKVYPAANDSGVLAEAVGDLLIRLASPSRQPPPDSSRRP